MRKTIKDTFSLRALPPEARVWQANPTDQKTLLALQSGNVSGVHVPGGSPQEKAAKEKEESEDNFNLLQQVAEATYERFNQALEEVKGRIAETRQYFQNRLDDLDQDEEDFKKDVILLPQGLEVYPDAHDPRHYFYQDETGGWRELQNEKYLEQTRDIHREKGAVHTMQNKQEFDRYRDRLYEDVKTLDQIEAESKEIDQKVKQGEIHPDEAIQKLKKFEERIEKLETKHKEMRGKEFGEKAELMKSEKSFLKDEFMQSADQKGAPVNNDSDLLEEFGAPKLGPGSAMPTLR